MLRRVALAPSRAGRYQGGEITAFFYLYSYMRVSCCRERVRAQGSSRRGGSAALQIGPDCSEPATARSPLEAQRRDLTRSSCRGCMPLAMPAPGQLADLWSVILYAGPGASLTGVAGAHRLGLLAFPATRIDVSTPCACRSSPGIVVHGRRRHPRRLVDGVPVDPDWLERFASNAEHYTRRRATPAFPWEGRIEDDTFEVLSALADTPPDHLAHDQDDDQDDGPQRLKLWRTRPYSAPERNASPVTVRYIDAEPLADIPRTTFSGNSPTRPSGRPRPRSDPTRPRRRRTSPQRSRCSRRTASSQRVAH